MVTSSPPTTPAVTVVIPARNEANDIVECIDSIGAQDYPHEAIEVLVIDGDSTDETRLLAKEALANYRFANADVLTNPVATTPTNLNMGLDHAQGHYLCRVDSRSRIPTDYIRRCAGILDTTDEIVVAGGSQIALPPDDSPTSTGIARALNNRYSMGGSRYRRQHHSGPCDTVYLGFFRTDIVRRIGGWDVTLPTNQDFDLNQRMNQHGTVWFEAHMPVGYIPRPSLKKLWRQYVRFGSWKVRYWRRDGNRIQPRQVALVSVAPTAATAGLVALAVAPNLAKFAPAAAVAGLAAIEAKGTNTPEGTLVDHAVATAAIAVVSTGWSWGVWRELLRPSDTLDGHDSK